MMNCKSKVKKSSGVGNDVILVHKMVIMMMIVVNCDIDNEC